MDVEFTKWLSEEVFKDSLGKSIFRKDCLSEDEVSLLSECWQASRKSIKLSVPVWSNDKHHRFTYSDPLIKQLDKYGIQIK